MNCVEIDDRTKYGFCIVCFSDRKKCIAYLLNCGQYAKQFGMMKLILLYAEQSQTHISSLFDGIATDVPALEPLLVKINPAEGSMTLFKNIRRLINHLNRSTMNNVVSRALRFAYFDQQNVELFPVSVCTDRNLIDYVQCISIIPIRMFNLHRPLMHGWISIVVRVRSSFRS